MFSRDRREFIKKFSSSVVGIVLFSLLRNKKSEAGVCCYSNCYSNCYSDRARR